MHLRADSLNVHLSKNLARLYVIYGDEPLLAQEAADGIRAAARQANYTDRLAYMVERGFDWSLLLGASQSMPLFGERRLIELRIPTGKPGKEGSKALQTLAHINHPDRVTLIILPRLDGAAQKSAWFTALVDAGVAVRIEAIGRAQLPDWINQRLMAQGQRAPDGADGRRALQFIAERVEGNLLAAQQEIQKLGLLYPSGALTLEQIYDAVLNVTRYQVFKLAEVMLTGDVRRLARMFDGLRSEGEAPALALWTIVEAIRALLSIKRGIAAGKPIATLLRESRVRGERERLIKPALAKLTEPALEASLMFAARLDRQIKGLLPGKPLPPANPWDGLFELAMQVATPLNA